MSEAKHTPGPWKVELNKRASGWVEVKGPSFGVHGPTQAADLRLSDEIKRIADARLIAAAPELLDCLKEARRHLSGADIDLLYIDEVISKAEGRS